VIERFTRTSVDTMLYRVTIDDPSTFTMPWTADLPGDQKRYLRVLRHEGNYALEDILRAARMEEKQAGVAP
jgi:hypothetical protein